MSDNELVRLLESDDPTSYKIPMSIGEPRAEIDKSMLNHLIEIFWKSL